MEKISLTLRLYAEFKKINQIVLAFTSTDQVEEFTLSAMLELTKTKFESPDDLMLSEALKRYLRSMYLHICCGTTNRLEEFDPELEEFQKNIVHKFYENNNIDKPEALYDILADIIDDAKYFFRDVENLVNQFDPIMVKARQEKQRAEKEELEKSIAATPIRDRRGEFFDYNKETIRSIDEFLEKLS